MLNPNGFQYNVGNANTQEARLCENSILLEQHKVYLFYNMSIFE